MKFLMTISLLATLSISNAFAQEDGRAVSASVSGAASWIALSIYAPQVAAGLAGTTAVGYTSMSLGVTALANQKTIIKNAVNTDVQDFYNNGTLTEALAQTIKQIKKDSEMSDAEAIDILIQSINE